MENAGSTSSFRAIVVIPSFNTGVRVVQTVREALAEGWPVRVVVDGSTDGTPALLEELARSEPDLSVTVLDRNEGKGAAVLAGAVEAEREGFTHLLTMDADGQHFADRIPAFMELARKHPEAMILGCPVFDASAPRIRVVGRRACNFWVHVWTLWAGIDDSMFGFRVYPVGPFVAAMGETRFARRYDFDAEVAVRLFWRGVRPISVPCPVRYLVAEEGGVSHYRYLRDNLGIAWMHHRLLAGFLRRLPRIIRIRRRLPSASSSSPSSSHAAAA